MLEVAADAIPITNASVATRSGFVTTGRDIRSLADAGVPAIRRERGFVGRGGLVHRLRSRLSISEHAPHGVEQAAVECRWFIPGPHGLHQVKDDDAADTHHAGGQ